MSTNEEGRRLASQRDDLIAQGVDPSLLDVPLAGTAPTPPAVPDWLEAAVGALGDEVFCADHVNGGMFEDDGELCRDCDSVRGRIILATLPHITRGAADAVEADGYEAGYAMSGSRAYIEAATIVRNFGSEVGRA